MAPKPTKAGKWVVEAPGHHVFPLPDGSKYVVKKYGKEWFVTNLDGTVIDEPFTRISDAKAAVKNDLLDVIKSEPGYNKVDHARATASGISDAEYYGALAEKSQVVQSQEAAIAKEASKKAASKSMLSTTGEIAPVAPVAPSATPPVASTIAPPTTTPVTPSVAPPIPRPTPPPELVSLGDQVKSQIANVGTPQGLNSSLQSQIADVSGIPPTSLRGQTMSIGDAAKSQIAGITVPEPVIPTPAPTPPPVSTTGGVNQPIITNPNPTPSLNERSVSAFGNEPYGRQTMEAFVNRADPTRMGDRYVTVEPTSYTPPGETPGVWNNPDFDAATGGTGPKPPFEYTGDLGSQTAKTSLRFDEAGKIIPDAPMMPNSTVTGLGMPGRFNSGSNFFTTDLANGTGRFTKPVGMWKNVGGTLAAAAAAEAGKNYINSHVPNGPGKDVANNSLTAAQLGLMGGPVTSTAALIATGGVDSALHTDLGNQALNSLRNNTQTANGQNINPFIQAATGFAPQLKAASWLGEKLGVIDGGETNATMSDMPGFSGGSTPPAQEPVRDATINNPDPQDRFNRLMEVTKLTGQDRQGLSQLYNLLKQTGASEEEAWNAVKDGAMSTYQANSEREKSLAEAAAQQAQIQKYMQPYADQLHAIGQLQAQALGGLTANLPASMQYLGNFYSQQAPTMADMEAAKLMASAAKTPYQVADELYQAQQASIRRQAQQQLDARTAKQLAQQQSAGG